jgi:hypothetical protein
MTDEILKLAEEFGFKPMGPIHDEMLEAFYHAAFNAGLEAAAQEVEKGIFGHFECGTSIRALKGK